MSHEYFMQLAIKEAKKGQGKVSPNPLVGAVIVKNNKVLAKGYHGEMGKLHAERVVLEKVKGKNLEDAILYVTLEPCCHYGKTPPCTDAILESKIQKVVVAQKDSNPQVNGEGIKILEESGMEVVSGILEDEAKFQVRFFRYWIKNKKPYFYGKLAVSQDGFYGKKGEDILISSPETKKITREKRNKFDAILIGKKTLFTDNPELSASQKNILRIVFCQRADFSIQNLKVFRDENVIIACKEKTESCDFPGEIIFYENINDFKSQIFKKGVQSVLVEGGGAVLKVFLEEENGIQEMLLVESKNKKLGTGLKIPVIPECFREYEREDLGGDLLIKISQKGAH